MNTVAALVVVIAIAFLTLFFLMIRFEVRIELFRAYGAVLGCFFLAVASLTLLGISEVETVTEFEVYRTTVSGEWVYIDGDVMRNFDLSDCTIHVWENETTLLVVTNTVEYNAYGWHLFVIEDMDLYLPKSMLMEGSSE
jgi:hypothetical protein